MHRQDGVWALQPGRDVRRVSSGQAAYKVLRNAIVRGDLPPSARLTEVEVAARLGVSRTPVREALHLLEAEGYVARLRTGGAVVAGVDPEDVREVCSVRAALEALVTAEATRQVTDDALARLDVLVTRIEGAAAAGDVQELLRQGRRFHDGILALSGNRRAKELIFVLRRHSDRYRALSTELPRRQLAIAGEHRQIVERLRARDEDGAAALMRRHILEGQDGAIEAARRFKQRNVNEEETQR